MPFTGQESVRVKSGEEMDEERHQNIAYEYLCHLQEAKDWISACIRKDLPPTTELEESLRSGVYLAQLAHYFAPDVVQERKIFDPDLVKYRQTGLHFRHTDNINFFLKAVQFVGLPDIFLPETTDIYDKKNMPKVIFCIHALSLYLYKLGVAPQIQDLYGKVTFTDEEINNMQSALDAHELPMPQFQKVGGMLEANFPVLEEANKPHIPDHVVVGFQARARGFLVRQKLFAMLAYYYDRENMVIKAQAIWRGVLVRRRTKALLESVRKKRPQFKPLWQYRRHEDKIFTIQRAWRRYRNRKDFDELSKSKEMNLPLVRKHLHLLDVRNEDFDQELKLQSLKAEITKAIRLNQQLEKDISSMDVKIGLLVKNRISVQDVVAHSKSLSRRVHLQRKETFYLGGSGADDGSHALSTAGLKALKKESREKLDGYQHLFYLLQTEPSYLAKLVFAMPQVKTTKFLESVILTLFNFGANPREEYLLLKLFQKAMEEEVQCKVNKPSDIISGHPMVVKMIVSFNRTGKGLASLREVLGPLVQTVLEDKTLHISTSPVEIYKQWVIQLETESGTSSGLPYDVNAQKALEHEEVRKRLQRYITRLKQYVTLFLTTIVKSKSKLPYGLLYMAKVLFNALRAKFPDHPEKDLLKVIGNLVYYRYINFAIVAPDSCDIVDMRGNDKGLNNEQRKNLGSIAKILQFAAAKKGFGEESAHLMCLNQYIVDSHEKMKIFFAQCCQVQDPEDEFAIDQFYEATLIAKPAIYISLAEICDTHQLLLDYRDRIATDDKDPLHELLEDLGENPSLCSLLGATDPTKEAASLSQLGQTEVCLTLTNKFEIPSVHHLDTDRLFVKTKQLIMAILPCTKESNLLGCLKSKCTPEQEDLYWHLVEKKEETDRKAENNRTMLDHTNLFQDDDGMLPLEECKHQILKNLQILERYEYVSKKNGFQAIIASLGRDIINQREYRTRRRKDIMKLKRTLESLEKKHRFYESQMDYYNQYLKQCLSNLQASDGKKRVRFRSAFIAHPLTSHKKINSKQAVAYSGSKLHEKGVLLTIEGLPENQFKNVHFEFVPSSEDGVFDVSARFMGVKLEHVEIDIQELLQLQYEGVSVLNLFAKARINVNLLLHLLNTKFYGRRY